MSKARVYLRPGEAAPPGVTVKRGPRGGRYYETEEVPEAESEFRVVIFTKEGKKIHRWMTREQLQRRREAGEHVVPVGEIVSAHTFKRGLSSESQAVPEIRSTFDGLQRAKSIDEQIRILERFKPSECKPEHREQARQFKRKVYKILQMKIWHAECKYLGTPTVSRRVQEQTERPLPEAARPESEIGEIIADRDEKILEDVLVPWETHREEVGYYRALVEDTSEFRGKADLLSRLEQLETSRNSGEAMRLTRELYALADAYVKDDAVYRSLVNGLERIRLRLIDSRRAGGYQEKILSPKISDRTIQRYIKEGRIDIEGASGKEREEAIRAIQALHPAVLDRILRDRPSVTIEFVSGKIALGSCRRTGLGYRIEITKGVPDLMGVLLHEFVHAYEYASEDFLRAERKLWERRTAGRPASREVFGEKTLSVIKDRWVRSYAGRVYKNFHLECCSATMDEIVRRFETTIARDPETVDLVIGAMFEGRFELQPVRKARVYLRPGESAPPGVQVKRGPRGGRYYETEEAVTPEEEFRIVIFTKERGEEDS
ncbi:MAG: hypothetical protein ACXQTM_03680 [Methanosarcinales archaeon]